MGLLIFLFIKTYIVVTYYSMPILYIFCFIFYTFLALRSHFFLLSLPYFMFSHNFSIPWHFYSRIRNCNITQISPLGSVSISESDYCNLFYILIKKCTKKGIYFFNLTCFVCLCGLFFLFVCLHRDAWTIHLKPSRILDLTQSCGAFVSPWIIETLFSFVGQFCCPTTITYMLFVSPF